MKNHILALALTLAIGTLAFVEVSADNQTYIYFDDEGFPVYGSLRRVSPNGQWAAGGDEGMETGCFVINTSDPENIILNPDGYLLDIGNDGTAVGAMYQREGYVKYKRAAVFKDGAWQELPKPQEILGQSYAISISADCKVIAGHGLCANVDPEDPSRYFPIIWTLNEQTGEYELTRLYNDLDLPGTLGFFVYCMSPDAKYVCGIEPLDFGDVIGVILNIETGELKRFHNIEYKNWYFDTIEGYFDTMFVDGYMDGITTEQAFGEMFLSCSDRYVYGSHSVVTDVQEDGSGIITNYAAIYDLQEDRFIDGRPNEVYLCGIGDEVMFTTNGDIVIDDEQYNVNFYFAAWDNINGIYSVDKAGRVLAGAWVGITEFGEMYESPVLLMLDEESAIASQKITVSDKTHALVTLRGRTITVQGAENVAIYTSNGMLVTRSHNAVLAPGTYIVTADGTSRKICVK